MEGRKELCVYLASFSVSTRNLVRSSLFHRRYEKCEELLYCVIEYIYTFVFIHYKIGYKV
jgi:hypothetical protein